MDARTLEDNWWHEQHYHGQLLEKALACHDIQFLFAFLRSRGWSQTAIAHRTTLGESRVRDVLTGRRRITSYEVLMRICEGLSIDPAVMGLSSAGTSNDWGGAALEHARKSKHLPANVHAAELLTDLSRLSKDLKTSLISARLWGLLGLAHLKSGAFQPAQQAFDTARQAATASRDPEVQAWVYAQEAYLRFYEGDMGGTVATALQAQRHAPQMTCSGTALAAAIEARAWATVGATGKARDALDRTRRAVAATDPSAMTTTAFGYDQAQLHFHESSVLTQLGLTGPAMQAQIAALRTSDPANYTDRTMTLLDRATCLTIDGHADVTATLLLEVIRSLTAAQRMGLIDQRIRQVIRLLPPEKQTDELREILVATSSVTRRTP